MGVLAADDYAHKINRIVSFLDEENIKILGAMKENGPRNLQRIARKAGLPYATVYTRVSRLEAHKLLHTWIHPDYSKLGLSRVMVLLTPLAGQDLLAREALKIPGYWLRIIRCMGECNGYYSLHAVPSENRQDFEHYVDHLVASGLASNYRMFWLDEAYSPLPNFDYYKDGVWTFDWQGWLRDLTEQKGPRGYSKGTMRPAPSVREGFDEKDLIILRELAKNARMKLSELATMVKVTLPAVKYRFDNLSRRGMIRDFVIDFLPYAPEVSDLYEIRLDFRDEETMYRAGIGITALPFVMTRSDVRGANSTTLRAYLPHGEMNNLITLLSSLVRQNVLSSFSLLLLDPTTIQAQSFPQSRYSDQTGWHYDNRSNLGEARKLTVELSPEARALALGTFERNPTATTVQ